MADVDAGVRPSPGRCVVFLGPPGAGKGTQASLVAEHLGVPRISTGDMLRDAIAQGTPLGRQAAPLMEKGGLVPDELLFHLIQERLARGDCARGCILDGFPRTLRQAEGLADMKGEHAGDDLVVVHVEVPKQELLRRLSGRRWCPKCQATYHVDANPPREASRCDRDGTPLIQREDDKETAVARRLAEYEERTAPVIDYYRERSRFHRVDGHRPVEAVFGDLSRIIEANR